MLAMHAYAGDEFLPQQLSEQVSETRSVFQKKRQKAVSSELSVSSEGSVEMEEVGAMAMAITWPDVGLSFETLPALFDCNYPARTCSLESVLDEWMKEDPIDNMAEMEIDSIPSSCVDLFSVNLEQELSSYDFHLHSGDFQQQNLPSTSFTLSLDSIDSTTTTTTSTPKVADSSDNSPALADLRKIIVKKPILDKAVERLGGGKDGALKLWKLIQVWLKHRKSSSETPSTTVADEARFDAITFEDLLPTLQMDPPLSAEAPVGHACTSQPPSLPENEQQQINNVSMDLPLGSRIRAFNVSPSPPLTPPALDLRVAGVQNQTTAEGSEQQQDMVKQLQKGLIPQEGLVEAMDVPTVLPIIDAVAGEALMARSCTNAAATRAARKNRMARQRRSTGKRHTHLQRAACLGYRNNGVYLDSFYPQALQIANSPYTRIARGRKPDRNLKHFLQKELKPTDVHGNLNRIVSPKKESERYLPNLTAREGVAVSM